MKKLFLFLLPLAIWSCNKGDVTTTGNNDAPSELSEKLIDVAFTAVGENVSDADEQTKVHFKDLEADSYSQLWEVGNEVAVYSGQGTQTSISVSAAYDNGHADFSGLVGESSPYKLIYPNDAAKSIEGTTITSTLPVVQTAGEYGTDPAALVSVAYAENLSSVSFYNAFALIQFTLEETDVTSVMIEGANGEKIAGEFTVNANSQTPVATPTENSSTVVVLKPSADTFAPGTYAVAVFPQTFENGFRVIYKKSGTKKCSVKSVKSNIKLSRNIARHYSHDKLKPGDYKYYYLLDAEDLITWAKDNDNYAATDVVYLMRDIELTEEQAAQYVEAHNFYGEFNGNNHAISGLTCPLFGNLESAYVHDLQLHATIVANGKQVSAGPFKGTDYGVGILAHYTYKTGHVTAGTRANPKVENIKTFGSIEVKGLNVGHNFMFGGVIGASNGVPVTDCENNATVTFTSGTTGTSTSATMNMGGVIGAAQDATTANLTRCVNKGKVTLVGFSGAGSPVAAGCVGLVTQAVRIEDCKNEAEVEVASTVGNISFVVAGLAGNCTGAATVDGCENSGEVNANAPAGKYLLIGGLVGSLKPGAGVVKDSENKGVVTVNTNASNRVDVGGVIANTGTSSTTGGNYVQRVTNSGNIVVNGTVGSSSDQFRIGGIIGNLSYGGIIGKDKDGNDTPCYNKANITVKSPQTSHIRIAGGIGSTTNVKTNVYNIHNTGDITIEITDGKTCAQIDGAGIVGYLGTGPFTIANCSSKCNIVKTGTVTNNYIAEFLGRSGTNTGPNYIQDCQIGGSVDGTVITNDNKETLVYKAKAKGDITVTNITLAE